MAASRLRQLAHGRAVLQRRGVQREVLYTVTRGDDAHGWLTQTPQSSRSRWSPKTVLNAAANRFLPEGYPDSVGPDYLAYSAWNNANMMLGCAAGVLSMQALLCAVGVGQGNVLPLAASLHWVIKDGLGQLAAVLSASLISNRFDADPKPWRYASVRRPVAPYAPVKGNGVCVRSCAGCMGLLERMRIMRYVKASNSGHLELRALEHCEGACEVAARTLEAAAPFAPGAFLLLASTANLGKSVACLGAAATKAAFHQALAKRRNLADITGKAGSQAIVASLCGTSLGLCVSACSLSAPTDALPVVAALGVAQMLTMDRAMQALETPSLTRRAASHLFDLYLAGAPLLTPAQFARAETHLLGTRLRGSARTCADGDVTRVQSAASTQMGRDSGESASSHGFKEEHSTGTTQGNGAAAILDYAETENFSNGRRVRRVQTTASTGPCSHNKERDRTKDNGNERAAHSGAATRVRASDFARREEPQITIGMASLGDIAPTPADLTRIADICAGCEHIVRISTRTARFSPRFLFGTTHPELHIEVLLMKDATATDVVAAFAHARLLQKTLAASAGASDAAEACEHNDALVRDTLALALRHTGQFTRCLREHGWDTESACQLEDADARLELVGVDQWGTNGLRKELGK